MDESVAEIAVGSGIWNAKSSSAAIDDAPRIVAHITCGSPPCSWTFQESKIKRDEYQNDSYIHHQPFPELVLEEQEIYGDDNGYPQQYVKYGTRLDSHFSPARNPSRFETQNNDPAVELQRRDDWALFLHPSICAPTRQPGIDQNGWP
jgi:hypothetical protein